MNSSYTLLDEHTTYLDAIGCGSELLLNILISLFTQMTQEVILSNNHDKSYFGLDLHCFMSMAVSKVLRFTEAEILVFI